MKLELNVSFNARQDPDRRAAPINTAGPRIETETGMKPTTLRSLVLIALVTSNINLDQLVEYLTQL